MSTPLATLFTKIGFDIDTKSIAALDASLARLESRLKGLSSSLQGISDNKTLNAAARLANAQARKMNAEVGLQRQQASIAKAQAEVEKLRLRSVIGEQALLKKRVDTEGFVAKAKASSEKLRENTANKLAAAELRATPYAQRPTRPANDKSFNGIGGVGLNYQTAIGAVAGGGFISQAYDVANFSTSRMPQYEFLTGSAEEARKQIAFVDKEVTRLSLDMMAANTQYKQMLAAGATSIGLEKTQELFTNTSNLATMLGLTTDAQKRMTNAFSQMMSKGQVYSEELKGQLAESLPNAVGIFADALYGNGAAGSGDKAKLFADMDKGKIGLKELTKVIEYMGTLTREDLISQMLNTPAKKLAKLKTQWMLTLEKLNDSGFLDMMITALESVTELLVDLTKWIKDNREEIKYWATEIIKTFKWLISNLPLVLSYFAALKVSGWIASLMAASAAAGSFTTVLTRMLIRLIVIPAGIALAALAFIELYDTISGQDTLWTRLAEQKDKGILGYIAAITKSVMDFVTLLSSGLVTRAMIMWGHLTGNDLLVDSAKQTYAEADALNTQNQEKMWGSGWWATGNQPLSPQAFSNTTSRVLAKGTVDRTFNYNPSIEVVVSGATARDGDEIAKAIDARLKESLSKMSVQAMANTSPYITPLNF